MLGILLLREVKGCRGLGREDAIAVRGWGRASRRGWGLGGRSRVSLGTEGAKVRGQGAGEG